MKLPTGTSSIALRHDAVERPYLLHVPPGVASEQAPLLLELHGRGISAERFDRLTGFRRLADEAGFLVALPGAVNEIWNDGRGIGDAQADDVGYLAAVIADVASRAPVDPRRIYVVGMSNGATMAGRLVCELPDLLAAIAQVAGTAAVAVVQGGIPGNPLPLLEIHGTADRYARYDGERPHGMLTRAVLRHPGGPSVGVDAWAELWRSRNGLCADPSVETIPPDTTIRRWRGSSPASDIDLYRVEGGGHTWPGAAFPLPSFLFGRTTTTFGATRVCWDFLAAHARPTADGARQPW